MSFKDVFVQSLLERILNGQVRLSYYKIYSIGANSDKSQILLNHQLLLVAC